MQDGIPVNLADGSFMDPSISESIEVFKERYALQFGLTTLGGALNFKSKTGRQIKETEIKTEGVHFGYASLSAIAGRIDNPTCLDLSHLNIDIPCTLTLKMIKEDLWQINGGIK